MIQSDIKQFYKKAFIERKFSAELLIELRKISTENELENFIKEKIQPIANDMGYNFSTKELLLYEKEMAPNITEQQLENISGGINVKNLAAGGIVSLMALGAGVSGVLGSGNPPKASQVMSDISGEQSSADFSPEHRPSGSNQDLNGPQPKQSAPEKNENDASSFFARVKNVLMQIWNWFKHTVGIRSNDNAQEAESNEPEEITSTEEADKTEEVAPSVSEAEKKEENSHSGDEGISLVGADSNNDTEADLDDVEEFGGTVIEPPERNLDNLKRAYRHATLRVNAANKPYRGEDGKLKKNKRPRLAQLLERDDAIPSPGGLLHTPFGEVYVMVTKNSARGDIRIIVMNKEIVDGEQKYNKGYAPTYTDISEALDDYYAEGRNRKNTLTMLRAILEYLEIPAPESIKVKDALRHLNLIVNFNETKMPDATDLQRELAADLCGILMVCESGQRRSENGGKRERGVIRHLIRMVKEGKSETPFSDVFGKEDNDGYKEGFYTPAARQQYERQRTGKRKKKKKVIIAHGGNVRGQVVVGKVFADDVRNPRIPYETLAKDIEDTKKLDLSDDSEEDCREHEEMATRGGKNRRNSWEERMHNPFIILREEEAEEAEEAEEEEEEEEVKDE